MMDETITSITTPLLTTPSSGVARQPATLATQNVSENFSRYILFPRQQENDETEMKVYKKRWFVLFLLFVNNLSNGMIWMTFSQIPLETCKLYSITTSQLDWLSIVAMVTTVVLAIPAIFITDKYGVKSTLIISGWLNAIGSVFRILSSLETIINIKNPSKLSYILLLIGQIISGCGQPFLMTTPTKLASIWFPANQRTFANMIGSTANPLGILVAGILSSFLIYDLNNFEQLNKQMKLMLGIFSFPAFLGAIATMFLTTSYPRQPPSISASEQVISFKKGLKKVCLSPPYLLLALCYGGGVAILSTFMTILDQLLLPSNYTNKFSSLCLAMFLIFGSLGAFICSLATDKTKQHESVAKVLFALTAVFLISFLLISPFPDIQIFLLLIASLAGFFSLSSNPICLELSVESTFPVAEGTSSGLLALSGQIQSFIYMLILSLTSNTINNNNNNNNNYIINNNGIITHGGILFLICICMLSSCLFIIFFHCPYKRLQFEEKIEAENILKKARNEANRVDV